MLMKNANKCSLVLIYLALFFVNIKKCRSQFFQGYSDENLTICIDKKEKKISGFLNANLYVDDNPKLGVYQSCNLFFKGNFNNLESPTEIKFYNNFDFESFTTGNISINEITKICKIILKDQSFSCSNIFDLKSGEVFSLGAPAKIIRCARIVSEKAYFWVNGKRTKTYLLKGDFVAILDENKNTDLKIKFINKNLKTIEGWIKKSDVE